MIISPSAIVKPVFAGDEKERRSFDFFRNHTATVFAGYFDTSFWERLILQVSHSEPAVRHAVVALGSFHECLNVGDEGSVSKVDVHNDFQYSLQQYARSLACLRNLFLDKPDQQIDVILICCILFISFESLQGNYEPMACHLQSGSKIISHWQSKHSSNKSAIFSDELLPMFMRLTVQVKSLFDTPLLIFDHGDSRSTTPLDSFTCLGQARDALYHQMNKILNFDQMTGGPTAWLLSIEKGPEEVAAALDTKNEYNTGLQQWLTAFDNFFLRSSETMNNRELSASIVLKIHHLSAWLVLAACHLIYQCEYDSLIPQFKKIVSLSESLIMASEASTSTIGKSSFGIDLGVVAPLYFTASRCRDPVIRRKAVQLLALPRREGTWDSKGAALVASKLIEVEEDRLGIIHSAADVPESARVRELKVDIQHRNRLIILSCHIMSPDCPGLKADIREEHVRW